MIRKFVIGITIVIMAYLYMSNSMYAQEDTQEFIRQNPEMDFSLDGYTPQENFEYPEFINWDANFIEMNGDDWSDLVSRLDTCHNSIINIVHIGDSHLQADMATAVVRKNLGEHYGSAGRALIIPFKLAGTNEPNDYKIESGAPLESSRLLKTPWPTAMSFTGIGIKPQKKSFDISLTTVEPFDSIVVFFSGEDLHLTNDLQCSETQGSLSIKITEETNNISLPLSSDSKTTIHGFNLIKGKSGVAYHVVGNNGATFSSYNNIADFPTGISALNPSLIIISLGTNEAFGSTGAEDIKREIKYMISSLGRTCPNAKFLLTTPSECQKRKYTRRGKRRKATGSYFVNDKVRIMRNAILEFAQKECIPVYDFYEVAGGDGSSKKWLQEKFMNQDRVHLLRPGYELCGRLLTEAIEDALDNYRPAAEQ